MIKQRHNKTLMISQKNVQRHSIMSRIFLSGAHAVIVFSLVSCWDVTVISDHESDRNEQKIVTLITQNSVIKSLAKTTNSNALDITTIKVVNKKTDTSVTLINDSLLDSYLAGSNIDDSNVDSDESSDIYTDISNEKRNLYYDTKDWSEQPVTMLNINTVSARARARASEIATIISVDKNSLDFSGQKATKYRFMQQDAPYFDLVDSERFIELNWYFANGNDTDKEKQISRNHAEKAHLLARQLMGDVGGVLVSDMLLGQDTRNQKVSDNKVALAKCEFYSCMLVLHKETDVLETEIVDNLNANTSSAVNDDE